MGHDLHLDVVDTGNSVAGGTLNFVGGVVDGSVGLALGFADGVDGGGSIAAGEGVGCDVVSALGHGVVVAQFILAVVSTGDDTSSLEPVPGGGNLTTVATEGEASGAIAAGSSVGNGEESLEFTTGGDAHSVIESLSSAVSPA